MRRPCLSKWVGGLDTLSMKRRFWCRDKRNRVPHEELTRQSKIVDLHSVTFETWVANFQSSLKDPPPPVFLNSDSIADLTNVTSVTGGTFWFSL